MTRTFLALAALLALAAWYGGAANWLRAAFEQHTTPRLRVPAGWPAPHYDFAGNPVTAAGFALGRMLFYDPQLSRDGTVSCGSCHQQFAAFANFDHRVSHGVGGVNGTRNAPGLFNLAWQPDFMWDGAVHQLELQPLAPLTNAAEMGEDLAHVVAKLRADPRYPPRFAAAFGSSDIDGAPLLRALAQFVGTMVSSRSRYDDYLAGRARFSAEEQRGLAVFTTRCAGCHAGPLLSDFSFRNNGLDREPQDAGRALVSGRADDRGRFRVPSLRNVALTAPYMHDGRFATLEQVLDHYANGIQPSPTLDPLLARGLALDAGARAALLAFLDTLSDDTFLHDPRFAEPGVTP